MARNRQRAKQRQAERRARRLAEERRTTPAAPPSEEDGAAAAPPSEDDGGDRGQARPDRLLDDPTTVDPSPAVSPELAVGATPQDEGFSEQLIEHDPVLGDRPTLGEPPLDEDEALEEIDDWELAEDEPAAEAGAGEAGYAVRGRRGRPEAEARHRSRVVQFLVAVWAELQRVQWPNRQALVTLTGVVLGFVLIAGGYLGLLDAIFSKVIQAIL